MQVFFVNGRFIKSQLLTAALEEGYRNQLMKGRFPGCVVSVNLPVTAVDVNVHPAKTQVKFAREKEVFDAVYHTVLDCLAEQAGSVKEAPPSLPRNLSVRQGGDGKAFSGAFLPDKPAGKVFPPAIPDKSFAEPSGAGFLEEPPESREQAPYQKESTGPGGRKTVVPKYDEAPAEPGGQSPEAPANYGEPPEPAEQTGGWDEQETLETEGPPWRYVGEILRTYLICEDDSEGVWLIDKHAAHERIPSTV